MEQTPAPANRFLPPPGSSAQRPPQSGSTRKPVPAFSQLPLSSSSASSFTRASRFQTPIKSQHEEISTSFDDDDHDVAGPGLQVFTPFAVQGKDAIDEEDIDLGDVPRTMQTQHSIETNWELYGHGEVFQYDIDTPLPKRRRISGNQRDSEVPIVLSSSPLEPAAVFKDAQGMADDASDIVDEDTSPVKEGRAPPTASRFKAGTKMPPAPLSDNPEQKPVFRPPDSASHIATEIAAVLPEAFTPSRKKGKNDYVAGGLADTVRNMILGIATEVGQKGGLDERPVFIKSAELDACGQAILVTDTNDLRWVLPGQHDRGGSNSVRLIEKLEEIRNADHVLVCGSATHWSLPLDPAGIRHSVEFAARWNVATGSWN